MSLTMFQNPTVSRRDAEWKRPRTKRRRAESHLSTTYLIELRPGGPVKIGRTTCLDERIWSAGGFNDQLRLLKHFPDQGETSETALQRRFADACLGREMFDGDVIRAWLSTLDSE